MSQAGIVDIEGSHPQIPTTFVCNVGTAIPIANTLEIIGPTVGSAVIPLETTGSGNIVQVEDRTWITPYVVDPSSTLGRRGTFTTIQSAINQAVADGFSNPTVFIRPGTYNENLTLADGVNLKALVYNSNAGTSTNPVTIRGQFINSGAGITAFFEGIQFVGFFNVDGFVLTGSNNVFLNFTFCSLLTNSSSFNCFNSTAPGSVNFINCILGKMTINNASLTVTTNNCSFFGASSANVHALTNGTWDDIGSNGIFSITMANSSTINFVNTNFSGNTANITGSSASASNYLTNCSFNNRTTQSITATGSFVVSGAVNYASLGSGFYSSSPTVLSSAAQQGNVILATVQTGATYTVTLNNYYVGINRAGAVAVTLPVTNVPIDRVFIIKDQSGAAATNNITITPSSGTIDGAASYVINTNYGSVAVKFDGTNYFTFSQAAPMSSLTLTGNSGTATSSGGNINVVGSGSITTTGSGSTLTISSTGGGLAWTDVTGATQTLAVQNGYITDRSLGVTYTLPASGVIGDTIKIVGKTGLATITPNANQQILIGSTSGTVGATGTCVANNAGDCIELICITAGASTVWRADHVVGTWTLR